MEVQQQAQQVEERTKAVAVKEEAICNERKTLEQREMKCTVDHKRMEEFAKQNQMLKEQMQEIQQREEQVKVRKTM